jgi:hypothetical protein
MKAMEEARELAVLARVLELTPDPAVPLDLALLRRSLTKRRQLLTEIQNAGREACTAEVEAEARKVVAAIVARDRAIGELLRGAMARVRSLLAKAAPPRRSAPRLISRVG